MTTSGSESSESHVPDHSVGGEGYGDPCPDLFVRSLLQETTLVSRPFRSGSSTPSPTPTHQSFTPFRNLPPSGPYTEFSIALMGTQSRSVYLRFYNCGLPLSPDLDPVPLRPPFLTSSTVRTFYLFCSQTCSVESCPDDIFYVRPLTT